MEIKRVLFQPHGDGRGDLIAIEGNKDISFPIKRVYYIYDVGDGIIRGRHAHKSLEQVLICIHGSCMLKLDDGTESVSLLMDKPNEGIYVSNAIWREMYDFSPDAVLLVLASKLYDESDYIRDYDEFLRYVESIKEDGDSSGA